MKAPGASPSEFRRAPVPGLRHGYKNSQLFGRQRLAVYGLKPGLYTARKLRTRYDDMAVDPKSRRALEKARAARLIAEQLSL